MALSSRKVAREFPSKEIKARPLSLRLFQVLLIAVINKSGQGLVSLSVSADKAAKSVGLGCLVELASHRVDVGNINLHAAEVVGGQDAVGP